ncbi:hypothetical protein LCGC14_1997090, partial [marine sediment metagenome]
MIRRKSGRLFEQARNEILKPGGALADVLPCDSEEQGFAEVVQSASALPG